MTQHKDHFGRPIEVGDVALTAKAGGKYFDTSYAFVVVVSKTPKLLRVHQLPPSNSPQLPSDVIEETLRTRRGRKAGRVHPHCLIKTGVNVGLTQVQMETMINEGPLNCPLTSSASFFI